MERRPLSAPGYHPADSPANGEGEDGNGTEVMAEFAEMEERASEAMGKENRGHKLPLKELPLKRPRLLSGRASAVVPPTEDEFEVRLTSVTFYLWSHSSPLSASDRKLRGHSVNIATIERPVEPQV